MKMENINLNEVSIVDHPAHLVEGFAVIKSASPDQNRALLSALRKEPMPEKELAEVLKSATAEEIRAALSEEQLAELAPVAKAKEAEEDADILKGLPESVRVEFEKQAQAIAKAEADAAEARKEAEIAKAERLDNEAVTKFATEYTNLGTDVQVVAPALRKFAESNPEEAEAIATMLSAVNKQADGAIFKELGTSAPGDEEKSAFEQLNDIAKAKSITDGISPSAAFAAVVADPEHAALVNEHFNGTKESN